MNDDDVFTEVATDGAPFRVTATHRPTGWTVAVTGPDIERARQRALAELGAVLAEKGEG